MEKIKVAVTYFPKYKYGHALEMEIEKCSKKFVKKSDWKSHLNSHTEVNLSNTDPTTFSDARPYQCDRCSKSFLQKVSEIVDVPIA